MATRWAWSVGVLILVTALSPDFAFAQGDGPRTHWKGMLTKTNLMSLTYLNVSSNASPTDPSRTVVPGANFDANLALLGYSRSFSFFGRAAVGTILWPVGNLNGGFTSPAPLQDSARGFGNPILALDVNLFGTPAMGRMPELLRYEPVFTLDLVLDVAFPIGEYDSNSPVNIGQNRWYGRIGVPLMGSLTGWVPGRRTTLELLPTVWLFGPTGAGTPHDNFLGQTVKNKPLFELEGHLTRDFTESFWGSLDTVWYYGAEATIASVSAQNLNDLGVGFTLGYQVTGNLMLTAGYTANVFQRSEALDLGVFRFNLVFGWHRLLEGIKRLD
jgi:hypothetical protein